MSYILSTIKCGKCQYQMNVALGTFGSGLPETCPNCGDPSTGFEHVADGWQAYNPPVHDHSKKRRVKGHKKTWCELSLKEIARRNPDGKTPRCTNMKCFDCWGDIL